MQETILCQFKSQKYCFQTNEGINFTIFLWLRCLPLDPSAIYSTKQIKLSSHGLGFFSICNIIFPIIDGAVRSLPKYIRKSLLRRIKKNLKNIGTVAMNQVKLMNVMPFQLPLSYLLHGQNDLSLALLCGARYFQRLLIKPCEEKRSLTRHCFFFSKVGLRKFVLVNELFLLRPLFICHLTVKRHAMILWFSPIYLFQWVVIIAKKDKNLKLHKFILNFNERGSWLEILYCFQCINLYKVLCKS